MNTITLTMQNPCGPEISGGQRGEHRMVELVIPLPQDRLPEIKSCIAIFSCDNELVLSPLICERVCQKDTQQFTCVNEYERSSCAVHAPGESGDCYFADGLVHVVLWQRLTLCRALRVQLECYADDLGKQFIARSNISERVVTYRTKERPFWPLFCMLFAFVFRSSFPALVFCAISSIVFCEVTVAVLLEKSRLCEP